HSSLANLGGQVVVAEFLTDHGKQPVLKRYRQLLECPSPQNGHRLPSYEAPATLARVTAAGRSSPRAAGGGGVKTPAVIVSSAAFSEIRLKPFDVARRSRVVGLDVRERLQDGGMMMGIDVSL